jgi:hypothetical protein
MEDGPLTTLARPFGEAFARPKKPREPRDREFVRAGRGASTIAAALLLAGAQNPPVWNFVKTVLLELGKHPFTESSVLLWIGLGIWCLIVFVAAVNFRVGMSRSAGPRDPLAAIKAVPFIVAGGALIGLSVYVDGVNPWYNQLLFLLYAWLMVGGVTRLTLALRGAGRGLGQVAKQKAHGDIEPGSAREAKAAGLIGPDPATAIRLGRHGFDGKGGILAYAGERHLLLLGPNGSGNATRVLIPDLLSLKDRSVVVIDPKGELAAVTADYRRTVGEVLIVNPFNVLGLGSAGFNPLAGLDPDAPSFVDDAAGLGEALIKLEGNDPHWPESAQGLIVALLMWEVVLAREAKRAPSLENVRTMLTEADEYEDVVGKDGKVRQKLVAGLRVTAAQMIARGGFEIESLASRFLGARDEVASIQSTADTQTR